MVTMVIPAAGFFRSIDGARLCACAMACLLLLVRPVFAEDLPQRMGGEENAVPKAGVGEPIVFPTAESPTQGYRYREEPPALAVLPDGGLFVSGSVKDRGPTLVQIWDPATDTWTDGGELAGRYLRQWALALPSGRVLHLGFAWGEGGQHTIICEIGRPRLQEWQSCGSFIISEQGTWQDDDIIILAPLSNGRPAFMYARKTSLNPDRSLNAGIGDEAYVYDEDRNGWTVMKTQWYHRRVPVGTPVKLTKPLLSVYDRAKRQWIEANELGAKVSQFNGPQMGWDPEANQFAYVLSEGVSENAVRLAEGCYFSGPPLSLFSPTTGKAATYDVATGIRRFGARLAVFEDGTFVIAGRRDGSQPEGGFYQGKVSCAGVKSAGGRAVEPERPAARTLGTGIIYIDLSWKDDEVVNAERFARLNQSFPWPQIFGVLLVGVIALFMRDRTRIPNWALYFVAMGSVAGSIMIAQQASNARFSPEPTAPAKVPASAPCDFTGDWIMTRQGHQYRFSIGADGAFYAEETAGGDRVLHAQKGTWGVVGDRFVWGEADGKVLAIHRIQSRGEGRFALTGSLRENEDFEQLQPQAATGARCP